MNRGRSTLRRLSRPILTAASFRISGVPTSECPVGLLPCQRELADKTGEPKKAMPDDASEWKPDLRALDVEGIVVLLLGTTAAVTIAAAPSMVIGGVIFPEFRYAVLALAVCSLGLSLLRPVWALVGVSLGWPVLDVVSIALDIAQDPTARNLWPIEIVIFSVLSVAVAVVGAMGGWLLRRFVKQRIPAAMILVAAGFSDSPSPGSVDGETNIQPRGSCAESVDRHRGGTASLSITRSSRRICVQLRRLEPDLRATRVEPSTRGRRLGQRLSLPSELHGRHPWHVPCGGGPGDNESGWSFTDRAHGLLHGRNGAGLEPPSRSHT